MDSALPPLHFPFLRILAVRHRITLRINHLIEKKPILCEETSQEFHPIVPGFLSKPSAQDALYFVLSITIQFVRFVY